MMKNELPKRKSPRLKGYDYSIPGAYFLTICTKEMKHIFGEVVGEDMRLNDLGKLANEVYLSLPDDFPDVRFVHHIIMPNHIHCLLQISDGSKVNVTDIICALKSKITTVYTQKVKDHGWQPFDKTIWQRGFHDHIVRNGREYDEIQDYIVKNPMRWNNDCFNPNRHVPTHPKQ